MNKKVFLWLQRLFTLMVIITFGMTFLSACSFGETESSYSISGYVYDEYGAVEGVMLKSDLGVVYTDKDGKYTIEGIKNSVLIEPSLDGYKFEQVSKLITSETDDANFNACKQYTVKGYVKNNQASVSSAYVTIKSLSGEFITVTDEDGYFEGRDVAGESTISCSVDGIDYFTQTATIDNYIVNINLTSSFTINFEFDDENVDYESIKLLINNQEHSILDATTTFEGVYSGTVVELVSDKYMFNKPQFYISKANQVETIKANKIYDLSGKVSSGTTDIVGAKVLVDGKVCATTDQNGRYELFGLVSVCNISVQYEGLNFDSVTVNNKLSNLNFNGTKSIIVVFNFDYNKNVEITFGEFQAEVTGNNYTFNSVCFGDEIFFESKDYHFSTPSIVVGEQDVYEADLFALYDIELTGLESLPINEVTILLDNKIVSLDQLLNVYDEHTVSASYSNYAFSSVIVSANNPLAVLNYQKPYNATIVVKSGSLILNNAYATVNGNVFNADTNGNIELNDLIGTCTAEIYCDGFAKKSINIDEPLNEGNSLETLFVNLTYNISGTVKTGSAFVSNASVLVTSEAGEFRTETKSDGTYTISNLFGESSVTVTKDYFEFVQKPVVNKNIVDFDSQYKIFGQLTITNKQGEETPCTSVLVILITENNNRYTYDPDTENAGYYEFNNISGRCVLITQNKDSEGVSELNPESYEVTAGGEYNFNNKGYSVSGIVTSGGLPVEGVYVQIAGTTGVLTDENGMYSFELVTGECEFTLIKDGYSFGEKIIVSDAEDKKIINFESTYSVLGEIVSGTQKVSSVEVWSNGKLLTLSDENGQFIAAGLSGNATLEFVKDGFKFDSKSVNSANNLNIICLAKVSVMVKTGNISVLGYNVIFDNNSLFIDDDSAEIYTEIGSKLEFSKNGYSISSIVINAPGSYVANSVYEFSGRVLSGDIAISNVKVSYNDKFVVTDADGNFKLEGLEGEVNLTFEKSDYIIENTTTGGYNSNFVAVAKYTVSGTVMVGANPLADVLVKFNDQSVFTDEQGRFFINNVVGQFTLSFSKLGYTFSEVKNMFGSMPIVVSAYYCVSGKVVSGTLPITGANVSLSIANSTKKLSAITDSEGNFIINGVSGVSSIIVSKDGYNSVSMSDFNNIVTDLNINLTYNFTLRFTVTDVTVWVNSIKYNPTTSKTITLRDLSGDVEIFFEKPNTTFTQSGIIVSSIKVNKPGEEEIVATVSYNVSGTVTTNKNNIPVAGVVLKAGAKTATTDANGNYTLNGVAGGLSISSKYFTSQTRNISKDDNNFNFTVDDKEFAYMLYDNAYKNLDNAESVQIFGTGTAQPKTVVSVKAQSVVEIYIRDNKGNILRQNFNHGDPISGIMDPRVSLLTYYNASEGSWYYQKVTGGSVNGNGTANYSSNFTKAQSELSNPGYSFNRSAYTPYNVTGIGSFINNPTVELANYGGESCYHFTLDLNPSKNSECSSYTSKINLLSGQVVSDFEYVHLQFYVDKNGWIKHLIVDEKYGVTTMSTTVTLHTEFDYLTNNNSIKLNDIKVGNNDEIQNSLSKNNVISNYGFTVNNVIDSVVFGNKKEGSL